jgi:lysophospholipase L1-like esterase
MDTTDDIKVKKIPVWKQLLHMRRHAPVIFYALLFLVIVELFGIVGAPRLFPDHLYIQFYLPDHAQLNTERHLDGTDQYNVRDELLGWRNRPECVYNKWQVDKLGSRSTHDFTTEPEKPVRILLLGSSLINGGPFVEIEETITAHLEDSVTECINFGVMRYTLDQSYLYYKERLAKYKPNLLIVELGTNPCEGLLNQYLPFRDRHATDMPFLKPRFVFNSDSLALIPVPQKWMHDSLYDSEALFRHLRATDYFYNDFKAFRHLGALPLSSIAWYVYSKGRTVYRESEENYYGYKLLTNLMQRLVDVAEQNGAQVVFLSLPNRVTSFPDKWRKFIPDIYGERVARLRKEGFEIVDAREVVRASGQPFWRLYVYDDRHFTPIGNKLIADKLETTIAPIIETILNE